MGTAKTQLPIITVASLSISLFREINVQRLIFQSDSTKKNRPPATTSDHACERSELEGQAVGVNTGAASTTRLKAAQTEPSGREALSGDTTSELFERLQLVDPERSKRVHPNDRRKIIRCELVHQVTSFSHCILRLPYILRLPISDTIHILGTTFN